MSRRTVNLDNLVALKLHVPRIDNLPIYARVEGCPEDKNTAKTDKWIAKTKTAYTSPSNIRRIFITHKHVWVHLYKPIVGFNNKSLEMEKTMSEDLVEIAKQVVTRQPVGDTIYTVKGCGLSAIAKPWVCANIEEVYFDWTVLIGSTALNSGYGDVVLDCLINAKAPPEEVIKALFINECANGIDLKSRFPRLRAIGFIYNLEDIYHSVPKKPGVKSIEDLKTAWAETGVVKSLVQQGSARVLKIGNNNGLSTARIVKSNTYVFDQVVLEKYFNDLEATINRYRASKVGKVKATLAKEEEQTTDIDDTDEIEETTSSASASEEVASVDDMANKILSNYSDDDIWYLGYICKRLAEIEKTHSVEAAKMATETVMYGVGKRDRLAVYFKLNEHQKEQLKGVILNE